MSRGCFRAARFPLGCDHQFLHEAAVSTSMRPWPYS